MKDFGRDIKNINFPEFIDKELLLGIYGYSKSLCKNQFIKYIQESEYLKGH